MTDFSASQSLPRRKVMSCEGCFNIDHDLPPDRVSVYSRKQICEKCEAEEQALPTYAPVKKIYDLYREEGLEPPMFPKGPDTHFLSEYRHAFPPEFKIDLSEVDETIVDCVHETFGSYWQVEIRPYWQNDFASWEDWEKHKAADLRNRFPPEYVIEASIRGVVMVLDEHGGWWIGEECRDRFDASIFASGQITDASPEALQELIEKEWQAALAS